MKKKLSQLSQRSVARDLTVGLTATIIIVVVIIGSINYFLVVRQAENSLDDQANNTADNLAEVLAKPLWNIDLNEVAQIAGAYQQIDDLVGVHILDESDNPIYETGTATEEGVITERRPINFEGHPVGTVELAFSQQSVLTVQRNALTTVLIITLFVILAVAIATQALLRNLLTRPLNQLTAGLDIIAGGNYAHRLLPVKQTDLNAIAQQSNVMAQQIAERDSRLRVLVDTLEQRVEARTQRLELVARLGERLTAILDLNQLLDELIELIMQSFGYYHAHVYIIDDNRHSLIMAVGAGEAGTQMKAKGHSISVDAITSLVAWAARTRQTMIVDNVREAEGWLPNPLLPDTRSEMAVPIILEDRAVGVLDVQSNTIAGLDESDANLLQSLANYVAVAMQNADLFKQVETALSEAHAAQARYLEQAWTRTRVAALGNEYVYVPSHVSLPHDAQQQLLQEGEQQALTQKGPAIVDLNEGNTPGASLVAPIVLQDTPIGVLQIHTTGYDQTWDERDLAVVEAVLDQLAQTAENLRLFEETRERAGREQTIREITDKLRAAPNLERLVEIASREIGEHLGALYARLELGSAPESRMGHNGPDAKKQV